MTYMIVLNCKYNSLLQVSGEENEQQLVEAIRRYAERPKFMQCCFYFLFGFTQGYVATRPDLIEV